MRTQNDFKKQTKWEKFDVQVQPSCTQGFHISSNLGRVPCAATRNSEKSFSGTEVPMYPHMSVNGF